MLVNTLQKAFFKWLPLALVITFICGIVSVVIQQNYRQSANDPQIQMAEDTATLLDANKPFSPSTKLVDMATSLAPFIIVYDLKGNTFTSEAVVDANLPNPPQGVFTFARDHEENRVTWQPREGVRIAAVIVAYKNGYVLAGRNLREIEQREKSLELEILVGWIITLGASFVAYYLTFLLPGQHK